MDAPYKAPGFVLKDDTGKERSLQDYRGKWVILYFYPKADTPGCTVEACSLRDARDAITEAGAEIIGVSKDTVTAQEKFKAKYNLNFTLLTNPDADVIKLYGAWGKNRFGQTGILRKTFLIDPGGIVRKVYPRVVPMGHGEKVLNDLKELQAQ